MKDFKFTLAAIKVKGKDILFLIAVEVITTSKRHQRTEKKTLYNVDERGQAGKCNCQNPVKQEQ